MNKILCVFSMFLVTMLSAQTKTGVAGVVTDQEMDGEPLSFASVIVKGTSRGTTTDLHGKFDLNLEAGDYTLLVSFMGYEEKEIPVKVETGKRLQIEVGLNSAGVGLEEVVVQWNVNREAESVLLVEQKNAVLMKQAIGAQELSRKGVSDAEGAVTKISGISKQEGVKSVFVRGLGDRYNATTLNGFPIPSEDPEYKNISLDFFTTDIIQSIGIDKVFGVGTLSDVGGATINITSKELVNDSELKMDLSLGMNTQVMRSDTFLEQQGINSLGFSNRKKPSTNLNVYEFANSLDPSQSKFLINTGIGFSGGKKMMLGHHPLSIYGVFSHSSDYSFTEEIIRNTTTEGTIFLDQKGKKYSKKINQLGLLNANYTIDNLQLRYNLMLVHANNQYVGIYEGKNSERYQDAYDDTYLGYLVRQQNNDNMLITNQLLSDWKLNEKSVINLGIAHNSLKGLEPDRRINNFSKISDSNHYKLTGSTGRQQRYFIELKENDLNTKLEYTYRFNSQEKVSNWKIGYNGRFLATDFEAIEYDLSSQQLLNINSYKLDQLYNQANLNAGLFQLDRNFDRYDVSKFIHSFYSEFTYQIDPKIVLNAGLKGENVDMKVSYNVNRGGTKGDTEITKLYILPALNLKYDIHSKHALRFGVSKTYTMPQSKEISPYVYIDVSFKSQGNKDLKPSDNYNVDLKWDYYINGNELFSLSGFYKYVVSPIARVEEGGSGGYLTYRNISDYATFAGIELELRKNLFQTESELSNQKWSFGWNASLIFTELNINVANTQARKTQLEGAAPFITNADLTYSLQKNNKNFTASMVFNYFSDRIYTIGTLQYKDIIEKGVPTMDFVASLDLTERLSLKLKTKNIFNSKRELSRKATNNDGNIILNTYQRGVDFNLGLSYKF
ncbi:TonB-dependent receptor domain-containing protein [Capnocytophaga canis]|uniref:TonB-dependent receptor n=1 Tax=Capnocytophaga canis TaxID=1848903 RepID=UPI00370D35D6